MGETEQMHNALLNSFNPNAELRKQAEEFVMKASCMPGAVKAFYEIAAAGHVNASVRQAAAIRLKRIIEKGDWNSDEQMAIVKDDEKALIKSTILECVSSSPKIIQKQLLEVVKNIVSYDFPARWPTLGNELASFLNSNDMGKAFGALCILRKLVKRYENWGKDRRAAETHDVAKAFFPVLVDMFDHVNAMGPAATDNVAELQKILLKIFFSTNLGEITTILKEDAKLLDRWMTCLLFALKQPVDPSCIEDEDSPAWRVKKWAGYCIKAWIEKGCGHKKADKAFIGAWYPKYGTTLVAACTDVLEQMRANMPGKTACRLIYCMQLALGVQSLHTAIAPRLDRLAQEVLFPYMCFTDEDLELWASNPHEYTRKAHSVSFESDYSSASVFSMTYVLNLCTADGKYHDKNTIYRFLQFLDKVLNETTNMADLAQMKRRYGALTCIGGLRSVLLGIPTVASTLEQLLVTHVFPSYQSGFGFMRANAVWTVARFSKLKWENTENFKTALTANLAMIKDPEMPVRIQAGMSISKLVANKFAVDVIKPILGSLVQGMFSLMNEIDAEELVQTLEIIIGRYGEDLEKESVQICQELITHFFKITNGVFEPDAEYDMEAIAAGERCLGAIQALISAVIEKGDTVVHLQLVCIPLLQRLCTSSYIEFFDDTMKLITILTVYCKRIAPEFWVIYDVLHNTYMTYADDMTSALAPFDNFISKEPETFLSSQDRIVKLGTLCKKMLVDPDMHERDVMIAPKLIEVLLQHAKPYTNLLDPVVGTFYDLIFQRLNLPKCSVGLKILLCNVLLNGLWYNAPLTLQYLEQRGVTSSFFTGCFSLLSKYHKPTDLKVVILGMTSILQYGATAPLPAFFTPEVQLQLANQCLEMTMKRYKICLEIDEMKTDEESEEDSDGPLGMGMYGGAGDDADDDFDDDDDDDDKEGEDLFQKLCSKAREQEIDIDDYDEEQEVWSVIDEVSEAVLLRDYLEHVRQANPAFFQAFTSSANPELLGNLNNAAAYGQKRASEAVELNKNPTNFMQ
eukprot:TRINITY_DN7176_c0_g1_i1.p1 TRINITY_DN7176_c0_g1~~TRINITY_DN7176_c0_g1_i1.p1  ORF type:complete len:1044 (+),score=411.63 TRINITY_DN7176_c0_g1_i1:55-3132(+)